MPDDLHELFWMRHGPVMQQMGYRKWQFTDRLRRLWPGARRR
jgi:hypothetical protein